MKNLRLLIIFAVVGLLIISCDNEVLTKLNKNPNQIEKLIPEYSFTGALFESFPSVNHTLNQGMHYLTTYKEVPATGDKFFAWGSTSGNFNTCVNQWNRLNKITDAIGSGPENVNKLAACTILKVLSFQRATDQMGDLPYSEAMQGMDNLKPKFDTQESIYLTMLSELDAALTSMDASKPDVFGKADIFYGGDVAKWKKFGYTLMMRVGMRLSEIRPAIAQQWVEKAATGGVMKEIGDIALIKYADIQGQNNPKINGLISNDFNSIGGDNNEGGKYTATFIDHLKNTKDPRLYVLSVVFVPLGTNPPTYFHDTTAAIQRGMLTGSLNQKPPDFDTYSEPSRLYINRGAPLVVIEPAEAYLLLAEAAIRDWNVGITAEEAYNAAVKLAMSKWSLWSDVAPHTGVISQSAVNAYLERNPFLVGGTFEQQLEQISVQRWVSMWGDEMEVWFNWKRVKYPVFNYANWKNPDGSITSYPGNLTGGRMYRRFSLPITEKTLNPVNYEEAIKRQGFADERLDMLLGRVWWDTEARGNGQSNTN